MEDPNKPVHNNLSNALHPLEVKESNETCDIKVSLYHFTGATVPKY